jgi:hypothetical protein
MSLCQAESTLRLQGIRHVVAFQFFFLIKEQDRGIGAARYIHQAQRRTPAHNAGPVAPAGDMLFPYESIRLVHVFPPHTNENFPEKTSGFSFFAERRCFSNYRLYKYSIVFAQTA